MSAMNDVVEARATALSLRASAKACTPEQGALKFRLMRAAESLDAIVLLAVRGFDRIEQMEQQLAATTAGSGEPAERPAPNSPSTRSTATPADTPTAPVIVGGVDIAPLALAARILRMVTDEMNEDVSELRASVQAARRIVWEVFTDLEAASARGAT
jgi:predicted lipid-binding transport protein (Tim44 family)